MEVDIVRNPARVWPPEGKGRPGYLRRVRRREPALPGCWTVSFHPLKVLISSDATVLDSYLLPNSNFSS